MNLCQLSVMWVFKCARIPIMKIPFYKRYTVATVFCEKIFYLFGNDSIVIHIKMGYTLRFIVIVKKGENSVVILK